MEKQHIVLIYNDPSTLEFFETLVNNVNPSFQCISFIFGDEAIEAICNEFKHTPDYIFVNAHLKRTSGVRCLSALRENKRFENCRIGIFSVSMPQTVADIFRSMGANFALSEANVFGGWQSRYD